MKKAFIAICLGIIILGTATAQTNLVLSYNSTGAGRSILLTASKTWNNKNEFGGGLRYNINSLAHPDDQMKLYYKRLYATEPLYHFGIDVFYHFYFLRNWQHVKPFAFYDLQAIYSTTRNCMYLPYTYDVNGDVLYKQYNENFGPFTWIEQNIGIGFKVNLINGLFIQQRMGFGTFFILGYEYQIAERHFNRFSWEFGYIIDVGIGYSFSGKKKK